MSDDDVEESEDTESVVPVNLYTVGVVPEVLYP